MSSRAFGMARPVRRRTGIGMSALAALCFLAAAPASAGTATPAERNLPQQQSATTAAQQLRFGVWTLFSVGETGSESEVYRFSSSTPVLLRVTDAFCRGDEFRVLDRGYAIFTTSVVGTDPSCDDVPHVTRGRPAWVDQSYSKGRFVLQPGRHAVKIRITDSPFGGAGAFLRIDRLSVT